MLKRIGVTIKECADELLHPVARERKGDAVSTQGDELKSRIHTPRSITSLVIGLACVAFLGGCGREHPPLSLSLLPATESGRIEAVFYVPKDGQLRLSCDVNSKQRGAPDPLEVWLHQEEERGELLQKTDFDPKTRNASVVVDLSPYAGQKVFIRATAGTTSVTWKNAEISGTGSTRGTAPWLVIPQEDAPDVVVYLIDTLRSDVLGSYGGPGITPTMDRLAAEGTLFERAYSSSSWTRPSVASIFTGLPVAGHQVLTYNEALPESVLTLAERFRMQGYDTIGVVANYHVIDRFDFDQGFQSYTWLAPPEPGPREWEPDFKVPKTSAEQVHDRVLELLEKRGPRRRPLFLYVHTVDPHNPYDSPKWLLPEPRPAVNANNYLLKKICEGEGASPEVLSQLATAYRGAVAYADHELGAFLGRLPPYIDPARMALLVTSDHGESFFEHRLVGHVHWPHEELIRVPLILRGPGIERGRRVPQPASHEDVVPTLMALVSGRHHRAGLSVGTNLLTSADRARLIYSEYIAGCVLIDDEWKLAWHADYPPELAFSLFHLRDDPGERQDRYGSDARVGGALEREFRQWRASMNELNIQKKTAKPTAEGLRNLKAIGYMH